MGFIVDESMVRVDFWKESGKWYETVAIKWDRYEAEINGEIELIHQTFRRLCLAQHKRLCQEGWTATCLEPYHKDSHPISIKF